MEELYKGMSNMMMSIESNEEEGSWVVDSAAIGRRRHSSPSFLAFASPRVRQILTPLKQSVVRSRTPAKVVDVGEDVLVMDGVLVSDARPSKRSDWGPTAASPSPSHTTTNSFYKTDMCRSWQEMPAFCRYGSRCQFAHGKEALRGPPPFIKPRSEVGGESDDKSVAPAGMPHDSRSDPGGTRGVLDALFPSPSPTTTLTLVWPPTEADDAYFTRVLYGPSCPHRPRPRLPVFLTICPEAKVDVPKNSN